MNFSAYIKKHWYIFSIFLLLLSAAFIRFYKLGVVPHGMTWDEAAIGYNGYAVLTTRRDEWLERLPVSFKSFGDFKAPLAIYANGVFTYVFGMNLFGVRVPFAIASIFAVLGMILLTQELFIKHKLKEYFSLFVGFLMVTSSWHIHYSRAGFESGMALAFFVWGLYLLVKSIRSDFKIITANVFSAVFFVASIYTYHSSKIVVPLVALMVFILFFKEVRDNFKRLLLPLAVFLGGLYPFIKDALFGEGLTRAGVTIFSSDLSLYQKCIYILESFKLHFSPGFLLLGETTTLRHGTGYLGVLFITTYILACAGFIYFLVAIKNKKVSKELLLSLALIIFGITPAAIALEVPHSNRALLALPGFLLLAVYGFDFIIELLKNSKINKQAIGSYKEKDIIVKSFIGTTILLHIVFFVSFINNYFTDFNKRSTVEFNDGYLEAFELAEKYEKGLGTDSVDKVIFTSDYGQPYIYALFVRKTNPIWYQGGSLVKYEFKDDVNIGDLQRRNTLIVGSGTDDLPTEKADHIIYGSDGSVRFQLFRTN